MNSKATAFYRPINRLWGNGNLRSRGSELWRVNGWCCCTRGKPSSGVPSGPSQSRSRLTFHLRFFWPWKFCYLSKWVDCMLRCIWWLLKCLHVAERYSLRLQAYQKFHSNLILTGDALSIFGLDEKPENRICIMPKLQPEAKINGHFGVENEEQNFWLDLMCTTYPCIIDAKYNY